MSVNVAMVSDKQAHNVLQVPLGCDMERCLSEFVVLEDEEPVVSKEVPDLTNFIASHCTEELG